MNRVLRRVRLALARGTWVTRFVCQLAVAVLLTGCRRPFKRNQTAISLGRSSTGLDPSLQLLQGRFFIRRTSRYVGHALSRSVAWTEGTPQEEQRYSLLQ